MCPGCACDGKSALIRNVTDAAVDSIGCPAQAVEVLLCEVDKSDWAAGGIGDSDRLPFGSQGAEAGDAGFP